MIGTFTERHCLPMMTPAAILGGIGRIHSNIPPASFFRFAGQFAEKFRPTRIMNAFRKTMIMHQAVNVQVFHTDDPRGIDDLATFLMGEVVTSEGYSFMHTGYSLTMLAPLGCPLGKFALLALYFGKGLFFLAKEARVSNLICSRESGKRLESDIYPYLSREFRQLLRFTFNGERGIPLASTALTYREGLDLALDRAMQHDLEMTDARSREFALCIDLKPTLGIGEAVIAVLALETGKPRLLGLFFHPSEKGFHGQIKPYRHVLQHLGMDSGKGGTFCFQYRKGGLLLIKGKRETILFIGLLAFCQQMIIEPSALFQYLMEFGFLFLGGIDLVLKHLTHVQIMAQSTAGVKREAAPHLPQTWNAAFIPMLERQGLSAAEVSKGR